MIKRFLNDPVLEAVQQLQPIADDLGVPMANLAIAWVLSLEGVTGAIAGARNVDQVKGWLPAGDLELRDDVRAEIDRLIAQHEAEDEHSMADIDPEEL